VSKRPDSLRDPVTAETQQTVAASTPAIPATRWVLAFVAIAALTGAMLLVRSQLDSAHVALLYLLVVLFGSAVVGRALGVTLAVCAFLLFDWFFIPPYGTLSVTNPLDWLVLASFLVTSIVAAQLLAIAQRRTKEANARANEVQRFSTLGAEALNAADPVDALTAITEVIRATLLVDSCEVYVHRGDDEHLELLARSSAPRLAASAAEDASVVDPGAPRPGWVLSWADLADARAIAIPLAIRGRSIGVLRVAKEPHLELAPGERAFLDGLSYYAALGVERIQLTADASRAESVRITDRRADERLATISHDFRTPLATVKSLAHTIVERGAAPGDSNAVSIETEVDRLAGLVTNLLG
jgi:two-component system sensor histidine kinase KdpD